MFDCFVLLFRLLELLNCENNNSSDSGYGMSTLVSSFFFLDRTNVDLCTKANEDGRRTNWMGSERQF